MSIGLQLRGRSDTEGWIEALRDRLAAVAHPAAEPVEVSDEGVVSASTTPVGPGYHVALCEALDDAGRALAITWAPPDEDDGGDDTGYFHDRDLAAVERHMLQWLQAVATWVVEQDDPDGIRLALPLDHTYLMPGVLTPTGPRDLAWFRRVATEPRDGLDFFPWWTPGEDAAALVGRARCLMWTEVRWREPTDDDEEELHDEVLSLLRRARELDPHVEVPARAWCELDPDAPAEIQALARANPGPTIGYRRHPVRVSLAGGWSVEIPGELGEAWEDGTWSAWHEGRTVWFDAYRRDEPAATLIEQRPSAGEVLYRRDGDVAKKGYLSRGDDGFVLSTRNAVDGKLAVATIVYPDETWRDWALAVWASLRCG